MLNNPIGRFLYLNFYAFLLLLVGGGILLLPIWDIHWAIVLLQVVVAYPFIKNGFRILASWKHKMREYNLLIQRNTPQFSPTSFAKYMEAPCGRLLVKVVLNDLGCSENYKLLKKYKHTLWYNLHSRMFCKSHTKTTIHYLAKTEEQLSSKK